jgi:hypothetical protein
VVQSINLVPQQLQPHSMLSKDDGVIRKDLALMREYSAVVREDLALRG